MLLRASLALLLPLAACGGDSGSPPGDAAAQADAGLPSVRTVTCPPSVVPMVTTTGIAAGATYVPMSTTIRVGGIIKFMMPLDHNVSPYASTATDPGLKVDFGATACLEFDKAGSFGFACSAHYFTGTVVVQ
jgi:plastocyanin